MSTNRGSSVSNVDRLTRQVERSPVESLENSGRAVTDAVHERFRQNFVYCDDCKEKFIGNSISISNHFNKSHRSSINCSYCPGKVFYYYTVKNDDNKSEKFYYHKCKDWLKK